MVQAIWKMVIVSSSLESDFVREEKKALHHEQTHIGICLVRCVVICDEQMDEERINCMELPCGVSPLRFSIFKSDGRHFDKADCFCNQLVCMALLSDSNLFSYVCRSDTWIAMQTILNKNGYGVRTSCLESTDALQLIHP